MSATVKQLLARLGAGVDKTTGVCGGEARIADTRIPVWVLERYRRQGMPEAEMLSNFPSLRAVDLVNAWAYVDEHPEEIEQAIRENEEP